MRDYFSARREQIDRHLATLAAQTGAPAPLAPPLQRAMTSSGKRVRGILLLAAGEAGGAKPERLLDAAAAIEMIHASSLILDDLPAMDDALLRRGHPTLHREFGEDLAILSAVALLNHAYGLVARNHTALSPRRWPMGQVVQRVVDAVGWDGTVAGEAVDLHAADLDGVDLHAVDLDGVDRHAVDLHAVDLDGVHLHAADLDGADLHAADLDAVDPYRGGPKLDFDTLEFIHSRKTGALFVASAALGGMLANMNPAPLQRIEVYAKNLGLAFQITDDVLDATASADVLGKDVGKDAQRLTFVKLAGVDGARKLSEELVETSLTAIESLGTAARPLRELAVMVRDRVR